MQTFPPPPDWPMMVTLSGSPPKLAMLSFTHWRAATQSSIPTLPECLYFSPPTAAKSVKPKQFRRWLIETKTEFSLRAKFSPR